MTTFLHLAQGKKPSNGWVHFKCPVCPSRGYGPDTGHHLGIHTESLGIHCWRCGARELPSGYRVAGKGYRVLLGDAKNVKPMSSWKRAKEPGVNPWKPSISSLHGEWIDTPRGPAVLMPFVGTDGYQVRYTDGQQPKVRNFGISGPAWARREDTGSPVVVVEGWADGLGFPFVRNILALLGVDNYAKVLKALDHTKGKVFLALDNDKAGKAARDKLTRLLLQAHRKVFWALYEGKDPAAVVGDFTWVKIESLADMRRFDADQG